MKEKDFPRHPDTTPSTIQRSASRAFGNWLQMVRWDLVIDVTFDPKKFKSVSHELGLKRFRDGINWLGGRLGRAVPWIAFTEITTERRVHVHGLVKYPADREPPVMMPKAWQMWWEKRNGFVRIERYEPGGGKVPYNTKQAGYDDTQWDCNNATKDLMAGVGAEIETRTREQQMP